jgi:organic hydroperoxide reductase OsmC/OhrA
VNKITVIDYNDAAVGTMEERPDGSGAFVRVLLRPAVTVRAGDDRAKAMSLHHEAHHMCFIANSVNFPVEVKAEIREAATAPSPAAD